MDRLEALMDELRTQATETLHRALLEIGYPSQEWTQGDIQTIKQVARDALTQAGELSRQMREKGYC